MAASLLKEIKINNSNVLFNTGLSNNPDKLISDFNDKKFKVIRELKNTNRSLVQLVEYDNLQYIFKIPREKNTRKWIRFTTLFRDGEAFKSLKNLEILKNAEIKTNLPLIAVEQRKFGMVVDSYLVYQFISGDHCTKEQYPAVVQILKNIHAKGLIHGDSWVDNFISNKEGIFPIDFNLKKAGLFRHIYFGDEFVSLTYGADGIEDFYDQSIFGICYKLAGWYRIYMDWFRAVKKRLRGIK